MRPDFTALSAAQWRRQYPRAVLDEVQKAPRLIETIKAVYDDHATPRYVLLGSSQMLLLEKVRESLAGRTFLCAKERPTGEIIGSGHHGPAGWLVPGRINVGAPSKG